MSSQLTALYVAYSIVWVGLFSFLVYLYMRQRAVAKDVETLREEVQRHGH